MTKRDEILQCTRDAAKGAGFDPDDERVLAMRRNIAAVWLADYQLDREELQQELEQIRDRLLYATGEPIKDTEHDPNRLIRMSATQLNTLIAKLA